jgi:hypothetical protein
MHDASLHEEIVKVASDLFEKTGRAGGRDLDNWLEAERIVITRHREQAKVEAETFAQRKRASTSNRSITGRN